MSKLKLLSASTLRYQRRHIAFKDARIKWEPVIGLEVHVQINTNSKLFSAAGTDFTAAVNNQVSFFDAAIPGTLPVLNEACVKKAILTALAFNCKIHPVSWFDRKHYFYADLPAGYQITQQRYPFATEGVFEFETFKHETSKDSYIKSCRIKQIQLEQDSGRSLHDPSDKRSLVDLNRAGIPLMEIVFEPDLRNPQEASSLIRELMLVLRQLDTCSCKTDEGAVRCDVNISIRPEGSEVFGIRSEVKNLNGITAIAEAAEFEIARQKRYRDAGRTILSETRSWDSENRCTVVMRDKEMEMDYRFMPEPNLPPLRLSVDENNSQSELINVSLIRKQLPKLPSTIRKEIMQKYGLPMVMVTRLLKKAKLFEYFKYLTEHIPDTESIKICNLILMDLTNPLNKKKIDPNNCTITCEKLHEVITLFLNEVINRKIFHNLLAEMVTNSELCPAKEVEEKQLFQINDRSIIEESCKLVIEYEPEMVSAYHKAKGKFKQDKFNVIYQEVLFNTKDRANLILTKEILTEMLKNKK